ncbi:MULTISPECIES: hypothetical protein [unclassified Beijerinckia]|uniref:hypothetical protein n=1 Tax=unclassified Beijerinckia TaxID=2638183 RepID=UPI00089A41EB|nr:MULTISPECIES: hypothetical protein [unclassified Beijerinckia]MDH7795273.1 hypothetical protein [Beijerinckia sp. GAS462]SEB94689.1 hypothetical protein SAMN05443249_1546 [Beijerinckia sp. 28-YEA-48]
MIKSLVFVAGALAATLALSGPTFAKSSMTAKHRHYRAMVTEPAPAYVPYYPAPAPILSPRQFDPQRAYQGRDQTLDFNNHYY